MIVNAIIKVRGAMQKYKLKKIPKHIAFIIDGNGRWAVKRGLDRSLGHKAGMETLKKILNKAFDVGIDVISVYIFSTENWNRPQKEVDYLIELFREFFKTDYYNEFKDNVKLSIMGDYTKFPKDIVDEIEANLEKSKTLDTAKTLNIGMNYGGQDEIIRAVNNIVKDNIKDVTKEVFNSYLYTANLPQLDFIIRTSGEQRLSNFMLWQSAYSEFYFPKIYWPDFSEKYLIKSLKEYEKRSRRFGSIKENK